MSYFNNISSSYFDNSVKFEVELLERYKNSNQENNILHLHPYIIENKIEFMKKKVSM